VDVVASSGWYTPALAAMDMSQMVTQGLWDKDPPLLQLPGVTREVAAAAAAAGVEGVFDLVDMEEEARRELLQVRGMGGGGGGC
jgi:pre-mRNA-splicing helicase BRR2